MIELSELGLTEEQLTQVQKYVQSREDRVRTDYSNKLKDVNNELAKYKPVEKSETEIQLEERIKALELKEQEIANRERAMKISSKLNEKGLPSELAKYLNLGEDIDQSIEEVGSVVNSYFLNAGNKPTNHSKQQSITKEQFRKMSYMERSQLLDTNPELFKALSR